MFDSKLDKGLYFDFYVYAFYVSSQKIAIDIYIYCYYSTDNIPLPIRSRFES